MIEQYTTIVFPTDPDLTYEYVFWLEDGKFYYYDRDGNKVYGRQEEINE